MAEQHEVKYYGENEHFMLDDPVPLDSARLFKFISDEIWKQNPESSRIAAISIASVLSPEDTFQGLSKTMGAIDKRLLLASSESGLQIRGMRPEDEVIIPRELLEKPKHAGLGTYNWDDRHDSRQIIEDGEFKIVEFLDGHHDYARELYAGVNFLVGRDELNLSFTMQRYQYRQDQPTDLSASVWFSRFAESGYEGNSLFHLELTEAQETDVLKFFAQLGGIALDGFESS